MPPRRLALCKPEASHATSPHTRREPAKANSILGAFAVAHRAALLAALAALDPLDLFRVHSLRVRA
jgi:hypothetical protein